MVERKNHEAVVRHETADAPVRGGESGRWQILGRKPPRHCVINVCYK
jgi:hypothetical protein